MSARLSGDDMKRKGRAPRFAPISVREETHEELERMKGPGKTWDRFIREKVGLPPITEAILA